MPKSTLFQGWFLFFFFWGYTGEGLRRTSPDPTPSAPRSGPSIDGPPNISLAQRPSWALDLIPGTGFTYKYHPVYVGLLAQYASVCYQCSSSHWSYRAKLLGMIMFRRCRKSSIVTSAWEDRVQSLCTRVPVSERLWAGLPRWQSSTSDGRPVTSTPAVIFVVNADRPGDTSCDTAQCAWPCITGTDNFSQSVPFVGATLTITLT